MIRIDDDTYIDDTLVTCAEYQLFIDEMREQGKYYQPDHWTSYQFPTGQARAPIVGVRFSDAKTFCKWLTKREAGEWSYRLPTSVEVGQYPLANPVQSPLGYWFEDEDGKAQFAWVSSTPFNPRNIDRNIHLAIANDLEREFESDHVLNYEIKLELKIALDIAFARVCELDHMIDIDRILSFYHDFERDSRFIEEIYDHFAFKYKHKLDNEGMLYYERQPIYFIKLARTLSLDFERLHDRVLDIDRASLLSHAIDVSRDFTFSMTRFRMLGVEFSDARERSKVYNRDNLSLLAFENNLSFHIDILTLQKRIYGYSPAFEGIRLVKERGTSDDI